MNRKILCLIISTLALTMAGCGGKGQSYSIENRVILDDEQFDSYLPFLKSKCVAIF